MEVFAFLGLAFVGAVFVIRRRERRTPHGPDDAIQGVPDDLRDKNSGLGSLPNRGRPWGRGN